MLDTAWLKILFDEEKNMKERKSLHTWTLLFVVNGLVLTAGFILLLCISLKSLEDTAQEQTEQNLRSFAYSLNKLLPPPPANIDSFVKSLTQQDPSYRITLIESDGTVIADSLADPKTMENHSTRSEVRSAFAGKEGTSLHTSSVSNKPLMYFAIPSQYDGRTIALRLSMPVDETVFFSTETKSSLIAAAIILLAAVLITSFLIALQIVKPIYEMQKATEQYRKGNYDFHVHIRSPREMADLGDSFNIMSDTITKNITDLKNMERVRKDFVANVSHELKTPVTSIKGFTETLLDGAIDDKDTSRHFLGIIDTQCSRLMNIIEDLLTLSRLESDGTAPDMVDADLVQIVKSACDNLDKKAEEKKINLIYRPSEKEIGIEVNPGLIEQAVSNLVDNAIKYCPEGSTVLCTVETDPADKSFDTHSRSDNAFNVARIVVEDDGAGIPEELSERIFERFYRVDKGRSRDAGGTGLGLSIVRHIVALHKGTVCEKKRPDGKSGARFEIVLPLSN